MVAKVPTPRVETRVFDIVPDGREALQLSIVLWGTAVTFAFLSSYMMGNVQRIGEFLSFPVGLATSVAVAFGLFAGLRWFKGRPRWAAYGAMPVMVLVAAHAQGVADFAGYRLLALIFPDTRLPPQDIGSFFQVTFMYACLYGANLALLWVTSANRAMREQAVRLAESRADALRAELHVLRLKLNPHFMFNALSASTGLIESGRSSDGVTMLNHLSGFLRTTYDVGTGEIPLREELSIIDDYLEVERVRFGDRMRVRIEVDEGLEEALVPSFLLQPLAENAVKYGVASSSRPITLTVRATALNGQMVLAVEDDAGVHGLVSSGSGVGQTATSARLAMLYGNAATFSAGREGDVYRSVVSLPIKLPRAVREEQIVAT